MSAAFYEQIDEETYTSTDYTSGPWDAKLQHGGPPSALLAHALRRLPREDNLVFGRITFEILGPIPIAPLTVQTRVARPGKRVQMVEGTLSAGGRVVLQARAWLVAGATAASVASGYVPPPLPSDQTDVPSPWSRSGYLRALEWRFVDSDYNSIGPAVAWARPRIPLIAGEPLDGLARLLLVADSANGISGTLPLDEWYFIPPETTIHLLREPRGEWICMDAETVIEHGAVGLARSVLSDAGGPVGYGCQTLLVSRR